METSEVKEIVEAAVGACMKHIAVPVLMTPEEVAQKLGVSKDTIRAWLKSGELAAYELGARLTRIAARDVNAMLERIRNDTEAGGTVAEAETEESAAGVQTAEAEEMKTGESRAYEEEKADAEIEEAVERGVAETGSETTVPDGAGEAVAESVPEEPEADGTAVGIPSEPEDRPEDGKGAEPDGEAVPEADPDGGGVTEPEFVQCEAVHPKTGARCCLAKGHEGKHKLSAAGAA